MTAYDFSFQRILLDTKMLRDKYKSITSKLSRLYDLRVDLNIIQCTFK